MSAPEFIDLRAQPVTGELALDVFVRYSSQLNHSSGLLTFTQSQLSCLVIAQGIPLRYSRLKRKRDLV